MKPHHRPVSRKHICIDFEGQGTDHSKPDSQGIKPPTLLGARLPSQHGGRGEYRVWLLRPELKPITHPRSLPGRRSVATLHEALLELFELADRYDCRLVYFSHHENTMVRLFVPELHGQFVHRSFNIKTKTDSLLRQKTPKPSERNLATTTSILLPNRRFCQPPGDGPAAACRKLQEAGIRNRRWRSWSHDHQQLAGDLLRYNRADCDAVWRLINVVNSRRVIRELCESRAA